MACQNRVLAVGGLGASGRLTLGLAGGVLATILGATSAAAIETATITAEEWAWATETDGSGLYWDIIRKVYEPEGIELELVNEPYARGVQNVLDGEADAWVAPYMDEYPKALYPDAEAPLDADRIGALYDPDKVGAIETAADLAGLSVSWIRGYEMDKYITEPASHNPVDGRASAVRRVKAGRDDAFLDALLDLEAAVEDMAAAEGLELAEVTTIKTYMGFAPDERGRELRAIWNARIPALHADGTLKEMFDSYDWNTYPHGD